MQFRIDAAHPALPGHFPGNPIVPGVVLLDRVCAALEARGVARGGLRLPQVKFLQPLLPGQQARVELEAVAPNEATAAPRWRFRVLRADDGALLCSGEAVPA